jgi:integrase
MGEPEVRAFLTHLAVARNVTAGTQNHALNALVFLYRHVLGREFELLDGVERARRSVRVPVVLGKEEVQRLFKAVPDKHRLFFQFLYGTGLRLLEGLRLRIKDVDFERGQIIVRGGKGDKDRVTMLPEALRARLQEHLERVRLLHEKDLAEGRGGVPLPGGAGAKVSERGAGMGLAMGVSGAVAVGGSEGKGFGRAAQNNRRVACATQNNHAAASFEGGYVAAGGQAGDAAYAATFVRDASFGEWV